MGVLPGDQHGSGVRDPAYRVEIDQRSRPADARPTNAELAELLSLAADEEEGHRARALRKASLAAMFWPEEAAHLPASGRELTTLTSVGPWIANRLEEWFERPP